MDGGFSWALGGKYAGRRRDQQQRQDLVGRGRELPQQRLAYRERYTFIDADTINYEATFEDPKVFMRPFKMALLFKRNNEEGRELMEFACREGQESQHIMQMLRRNVR